ncbi:MAG: IS1380 family transposase [Candidatus Omnitrophica bacterium]|nr:IS1380 family transposase [Candidatus Omnitrophota bacterium]
MLLKNLDTFRIAKTNALLTSYAGLPLVAELAKNISLLDDLDTRISIKQIRKKYSISEKVLSIMLTIIAGGESLDDVRMLNSDAGLKKLLGAKNLPAANTTGEFLRLFSRKNIFQLSKINTELAVDAVKKKNLSSVTIDVDASAIESFKQESQLTYLGYTGYSPLFAFVDELKLSLCGVFRPGNASPAANALSFTRLLLKSLPHNVEKIFRSDSAWYNGKVMDFIHSHNAKFVIKADMDVSVRDTIKAIPKNAWTPFQDFEIAETVHTLNTNKFAYRLVVARFKANQPDLFDGDYSYFPIITNISDMSKENLFQFYRNRANCENIIKELQYGFALDKFPCGQFLANAAFFHIALLAYNLVQLLKIFTLPQNFLSLSIKTLRFKLLCLAAVVVAHAKMLFLKLPLKYPLFDLFCDARWRTLNFAVGR